LVGVKTEYKFLIYHKSKDFERNRQPNELVLVAEKQYNVLQNSISVLLNVCVVAKETGIKRE
jgi:hypothetical protein